MRKFEEFKGSLGRIKIDRFVKSQIFIKNHFFKIRKFLPSINASLPADWKIGFIKDVSNVFLIALPGK
jgi:hypothetical protein